MGEDEIKKEQEELWEGGFYGDKTKIKKEDVVDGIVGNQTKAARQAKYKYPQNGTSAKNDKGDKTPNCAEYSNGWLRSDDRYGENNIKGDAWSRSGRGYKIIANGFDGLAMPDKYDRNAVQKRNRQAVENFRALGFDSNNLNKDEVYSVHLTYYQSPHTKESYDEGKNGITSTHAGHLFYNKNKEKWEVAHNIGGMVFVDDFNNLVKNGNSRYGVTAIGDISEENLYDKALVGTKHFIKNARSSLADFYHKLRERAADY
jgi:hypothetical protein